MLDDMTITITSPPTDHVDPKQLAELRLVVASGHFATPATTSPAGWHHVSGVRYGAVHTGGPGDNRIDLVGDPLGIGRRSVGRRGGAGR